MKNYHYLLISLLCFWFIGASIIDKLIDELVENFILFIISLALILIAIFLDDYEGKRKSKQ